MTETDPIVEYWEAVRAKAKIGRVATVIGPGALAAVAPPTVSFGDSPELADELLALVLSGRKTATSMALLELGQDRPPRRGDLTIVLDGAGHPRALIRTTEVLECAFRDVTPEFAAAEGEGDGSLEHWRAEHESFWRRVLGDEVFSPDLAVLCERFEVVDPRPDGSAPSES